MASSIPIEALSPAAHKFVGPTAPTPAKMMAARGLAPLVAQDLLGVLLSLAADDDPKILGAAQQALGKLPERIVAGALREKLHTTVLHEAARHFSGTAQYAELILLNLETSEETVLLLAERCDERQLEIIAQNERRLERRPEIIEALYMNPRTRMSTVDRLMEFAVRRGLELTGIPAFKEAKAAILGLKAVEEEAPPVRTPSPPVAQAATPEPATATPEAAVAAATTVEGDPTGVDLSAEEIAQLTEEPTDDEKATARRQSRIEVKDLSKLNTSQRVRLAVLGNKEVRNHLMRDSNRLVAAAAIKSPRITDQEVITVAQSRSVNDEVIRVISQSREWTRSYQVRLNLTNNPKCPLPVAMTFLRTLRQNDLKNLAKSKNVPNAVAMTARRLLGNRR